MNVEIPCVHRRNIISTLGGGGGGGGDIMSTLGDVQQMDIMMHLGEQLDKSFQFLLKTPMYS